MDDLEQIQIGVLGAGGRAKDFALPLLDSEHATVTAVCDLSEESLAEAKQAFHAAETYLNYDEMLWNAEIDAVIITTPKQYHVPQAIAALEQDIDVFCEVPAGASLGECRDLVRAVKRSHATYMMAENFIYRKDVLVIRELVRSGAFGDVYYAVGERVGEEKEKLEQTKWRRTWRGGRNGITYPTHTLGPVLSWLPDDRISRLTCAGSGHHHTDPRGDEYTQEDTTVLLGKTEQGRLVRLRQDLFSKRPPGKYNFQLQGTEGSYESARAESESDKIWLEALHGGSQDDERRWTDLAELEQEYLPDRRKDVPDRIKAVGHNGADYFIVSDFIDCIANDEPVPIGIHSAMDMTLPGILSERAIENENIWIDVPDSRDW